VLLVADDDSHPLFETNSEHLADRLPFYYTVNRVYVDDYPPGDPITDITNYINDGSILVNYAGHGSVTSWGWWAGGSIFDLSPDVMSLNNTHKLPVVTAADCLNGYFVGTAASMAEGFQRLQDKGAVAVWASTSLGYPSGHQALLGSFYEAIFQDDMYALGAATTAAKFQSSSWDDLVKTFVLFGDPATPLGIPTPTAHSDVTISGPTTGAVQVGHTFNAAVHPITATQPITYVWQAANQSQVTHTGGGLNDTVNFTWNVTGTQAITVTATNALGTAVSNTHVITITEASQSSVFLPIVIKND